MTQVGFAEYGSWGDLEKLVNVLLMREMRHRALRLSWPLLYHHTVTGALVLLPSPPRIAPLQLRPVEQYQGQVAA